LGRVAGGLDVVAIEGRESPAAPVWVEGRGALGLDLAWAQSLSETDLAFYVGVASGGAAPHVLPWFALERDAFVEALLGLLPTWPPGAPYDAKRAKRRARPIERALDSEARAGIVDALADWEVAIRKGRDHANARCIASGLVASLAWSTVRRNVQTLPLEGPMRRWWPEVVRFATGRPFLEWACGLTA